jgi:D-alanyl-D-alanine carboxypeptidase
MGLALAVQASPAAAKYASIVINERTGAVLYAVNPDTRHYPASLTKVMTLYMVFEALTARQPASKLDLKPRERVSIRTVILGLAVKSANDAASAVAEALGGTERKFGRMMTAKARALGMTNTRFRNASGLPNRRQLTTARDVAILARALRRDFPEYVHFFKVRAFTYKGRRHVNHNSLLDRYAGADGLKTGFIRASGFNLAATAKRHGIRLISVVLGTRSPRARDLHTMGLLERGFEKASRGRHVAYHYDRNIRVSRKQTRINRKVRVRRARGARGPIRLSRLTPPRRPSFLSAITEQGSARRPENRSAPPRRWGVQVGTYSSSSLAEIAGQRARRAVPGLLGAAHLTVRRITAPGRTLYRAEFHDLGQARAERICARLEHSRQPCLPMTLQNRTQTGARRR